MPRPKTLSDAQVLAAAHRLMQEAGPEAAWSTGAAPTLDGNPLMVGAAAPPAPRRPVALRIDQVLSDGVTPSTTTFGLRRHMDCWWISL